MWILLLCAKRFSSARPWKLTDRSKRFLLLLHGAWIIEDQAKNMETKDLDFVCINWQDANINPYLWTDSRNLKGIQKSLMHIMKELSPLPPHAWIFSDIDAHAKYEGN